MYDYLIYSRLKKYAKAQKLYHMPGHKARGEFRAMFPDAQFDVTELTYSDNLSCPTGVIAKAQKDIAEILGATASFITTDGSSSCVYAMLFAASKRGNKIIVQRNSHQSVWGACRLFGLEPLIVQGEEKDGILTPPPCETIEKLISNDNNIAGVLITSPDYYGTVAPLDKYAEITRAHGRLLLVDEAHGAHLAFGDRKGYAGLYADMWVDGAHKTLPTLTQGAILSVNGEEMVPLAEEGITLFRTTSPSYPIMASVEYGVKFLVNNPRFLQNAKAAVAAFRREADGIIPIVRNDDWTKLLIDFKPLGISPDVAAARLEKKGVYAELSDGRFLLFYLSPVSIAADLTSLKKKLLGIINNKKVKNTYVEKPAVPMCDRSYSFQYALRKSCEWVDLEYAAGRMCAKNAGVTPPCIPVVVTGEIISAAAVKALTGAKSTFGITDGKICVVKK
ncbi:MAG: aminotransferase class I/II-fold pyridoxal phosphate-dependent enzyme [Clostridia bacterium]|nr:aminotransferase class I/II-fold pyridoxal phosphate-dependent enzyme [Clostridia bacterium]